MVSTLKGKNLPTEEGILSFKNLPLLRREARRPFHGQDSLPGSALPITKIFNILLTLRQAIVPTVPSYRQAKDENDTVAAPESVSIYLQHWLLSIIRTASKIAV